MFKKVKDVPEAFCFCEVRCKPQIKKDFVKIYMLSYMLIPFSVSICL